MGPQLGVLIKQLTWRPCLACIRQDNSARYCNMHHRSIYKGMEGLNLGPEGGRNPPKKLLLMYVLNLALRHMNAVQAVAMWPFK